MATLVYEADTHLSDPLDLVEQILSAHEWPYDRTGEGELTASVNGHWAEYNLHFAWSGIDEDGLPGGFQMVCAFDGRVPTRRHSVFCELMALMNARLWLGHFDLVPEEGMIMFRHGLLLEPGARIGGETVERLIEIAISECERFFPAMQFVIWGGKSADDALESALIETVGEA